MSDVIVAPEVRDLYVLAVTLSDWLGKRLDVDGPIAVTNLSYPRGAGQSHETILFDAAWHTGGTAQQQGMVVRIKPGRFTVFPDTLFEEQYRLMKIAADGGYVRVAKPLWFEADGAALGRPFFVMEKVVGRVPVSVPPYSRSGWVYEATPAQRRRMWESGVSQLAAVQTIPRDALGFLAGPEGARDGLSQELNKYARFVAWVQEDAASAALGPVLEAGLARLSNDRPANQPPGLVWGDARLGNMMFDTNFDVVAVMDWEQPSLGGALQDLGWWLVLSETMHGASGDRPHLEGMGTRAETLALWSDITGISAADIEWYEDFTRLKMSCCSVRMSALRQQPPPDRADLSKRLKVYTSLQ